MDLFQKFIYFLIYSFVYLFGAIVRLFADVYILYIPPNTNRWDCQLCYGIKHFF